MSDWEKLAEIRDEEMLWSTRHQMMIATSDDKSILARENEIFIEFDGDEHLANAKRWADELLETEATTAR